MIQAELVEFASILVNSDLRCSLKSVPEMLKGCLGDSSFTYTHPTTYPFTTAKNSGKCRKLHVAVKYMEYTTIFSRNTVINSVKLQMRDPVVGEQL